MRVYIEYVKNVIHTNLRYRADFLLGLIGRIIVLFVQYFIWKALLENDAVTSSMGLISLDDMTTYITISTIITILVANNLIYDIDAKIKSGQIAVDLIKPINYRTYLFCGVIGENIYRIFFELVPVILISIFVFELQLPSLVNIILFLFVLGNAVIIKFLLSYIFGLLGFWFVSVWHFSRFLEDLIRILAGSWIPLWFFPSFMLSVINFLPFKLIFFAPITIFLEKVTFEQSIIYLLEQVVWIAALYALSVVVWSFGIKKLVIQGG